MSTVAFYYNRSEAFRKKTLIESGRLPQERASLSVKMDELDPQIREKIVAMVGLPKVAAGSFPYYEVADMGLMVDVGGSLHYTKLGQGAFDTDLTVAELVAHVDETCAKVDAYKEAASLEAEAKVQREKEQAAQLALAQAKKAEIEADKPQWINEHGSAYLKRAHNAGYDCQRQYASERAAKEHPNGILDFDNDATYKDRACPSLQALDLSDEVGGRVVWLTRPVTQEPACTFKPCEAVLVKEYLGKYTVVYPIAE